MTADQAIRGSAHLSQTVPGWSVVELEVCNVAAAAAAPPSAAEVR